MKEWPENPKQPANFDDLIAPVIDAIKQSHTIKRKSRINKIDWNGHDIGEWSKAQNLSPDVSLGGDWIETKKGEYTLLELIICVAVQTGIEQGVRICKLKKLYEYDDLN